MCYSKFLGFNRTEGFSFTNYFFYSIIQEQCSMVLNFSSLNCQIVISYSKNQNFNFIIHFHFIKFNFINFRFKKIDLTAYYQHFNLFDYYATPEANYYFNNNFSFVINFNNFVNFISSAKMNVNSDFNFYFNNNYYYSFLILRTLIFLVK